MTGRAASRGGLAERLHPTTPHAQNFFLRLNIAESIQTGRDDRLKRVRRHLDRPQGGFSRVRYNRAGRESIVGTEANARPAPPRNENTNTGICTVHARPREAA